MFIYLSITLQTSCCKVFIKNKNTTKSLFFKQKTKNEGQCRVQNADFSCFWCAKNEKMMTTLL